MPENFELKFNEQTFVLKQMNPARKSKVIKNILTPWEVSKNIPTTEAQLAQMADAGANVPDVIWDFIKDEDKQIIGTIEKFVDEIDSNTCDKFTIWAMQKVKESNDFFLQEAQKAAGNQE
jgi:hypothetical protein